LTVKSTLNPSRISSSVLRFAASSRSGQQYNHRIDRRAQSAHGFHAKQVGFPAHIAEDAVAALNLSDALADLIGILFHSIISKP